MSTTIVIYTSPHCRYCIEQKKWLKQKGINYIEKKATDGKHRRELESLDVIGVPFTIFEANNKKTYVSGFNKRKLESLIKEYVL